MDLSLTGSRYVCSVLTRSATHAESKTPAKRGLAFAQRCLSSPYATDRHYQRQHHHEEPLLMPPLLRFMRHSLLLDILSLSYLLGSLVTLPFLRFLNHYTTFVDLLDIWSISTKHCLHGAVRSCNNMMWSATSTTHTTRHIRFTDLGFGVYLDLQFATQ